MTTDLLTTTVPPNPPPTRILRRGRDGRVASGVCAGLGRYFDVDPVLFRVLAATSAFFGGAGVLAYLLAWAAIPDEGTDRAPIDGWVGSLRRHRVPAWAAIGVGGLLLWALAFSWWLPGPGFLPILVAVLLVVAFGRRDWQAGAAAAPTVSLDKTDPTATDPTATGPTWVADARAWVSESATASRARRRRARPVRLATVLVLAATLVALGVADSVTGIDLQWYFWATVGIVGVGLLAGAVTRRVPWSTAWLLVPGLIGAIGFAGSHASFHDGFGDRRWVPTTAPHAHYRLAFGRGVLDLRSLPAQTAPRTVDVTMAAGQVQVLVGRDANVRVVANVHLGDVRIGSDRHSGGGVSQVVDPPAGATGAQLTVRVHLADGEVRIGRGELAASPR